MLCITAAIMLFPKKLSCGLLQNSAIPINDKAAPEKEYMADVPVPKRMNIRVTLARDTAAARFRPSRVAHRRTAALASPGFAPGMGNSPVGKRILSARDNIRAAQRKAAE